MSIAEKLTAIAENEPKVFDAGKQAERSEFWDVYQDNGSRKNYERAFGNSGWTKENFFPKYSMENITNGYMMFHGSNIACDLADFLEQRGLAFSIGKGADLRYLFGATAFTRVGVVDITGIGVAYTAYMFYQSRKLETIDLLIMGDKLYQNATVFQYCDALKNIRIQGVVASSFNAQWCPLTVDSMKSIISCLKNYAGTDSDGTYTLTFSDGCWAALEADSAAPDGGTWKEYVQLALGWAI
jgi:hypothetical protein